MDEPQAQDKLIGSTVGSYTVERKLGEGGMGTVYELLHPGIGKRLALKLLHAEYAAKPQIVQRFFDEARAVNLIGHPNIVDIIDFAQLPDGRSYITMEFLEGGSLADYIREQGALPPEEVREITVPICSALAAAHEQGIVHRDLKPENIHLVRRADNPRYVKVLDFGIAKLSADLHMTPGAATRSGVVMGTPTYMSPEQAMGRTKEIDYRTDIYALGVICYEMLSGDVPFAAESFGDLMLQHLQQPPRPIRDLRPEIAATWDAVVQRALAKKREQRFQSMQEFSEGIDEAADGSARMRAVPAADVGTFVPNAPVPGTQAMPTGAPGAPPTVPGTPPTMPPAAQVGAPPVMPAAQIPPHAAYPGGPVHSVSSPGTGPVVAPGSYPGTVALPEAQAAPRRSKLPILLGLGVIAAAATVVLFLTLGGGGSKSGASPPDAGAQVAVKLPPDAAPAVVVTPPDAAPPPVVPATPPDAAPAVKPPIKKPPVRRGKGKVSVTVSPWAEVLVDGKSVGYAPMTLELSAGRHKITVRNPELGKNETVRIRVEPGKTKRIKKNWQ